MTEVKAIGYTRLSQKSDTSIEDQKRLIRDYCKSKMLNLCRIFNDGEKSSGFKNDREEYQAMLEEIQETDVEAIVVRDRTRFGRDKLERMQRFIELYRRGVEIHIVSEGTKVDFGDDFELVKESFHAEKDDVAKREEMRKARVAVDRRKENGFYQGNPPFGLKFDDEKKFLVPNDNFEKARKVIELRDQGESYPVIAERVDGMTVSKAWRICSKNRERYEEFLEGGF